MTKPDYIGSVTIPEETLDAFVAEARATQCAGAGQRVRVLGEDGGPFCVLDKAGHPVVGKDKQFCVLHLKMRLRSQLPQPLQQQSPPQPHEEGKAKAPAAEVTGRGLLQAVEEAAGGVHDAVKRRSPAASPRSTIADAGGVGAAGAAGVAFVDRDPLGTPPASDGEDTDVAGREEGWGGDEMCRGRE